MSKKYNREKIGEIVQKITELNMSYVDGAKQFDIPVRDIYRYNNESKNLDNESYAEDDHNNHSHGRSIKISDEEKNELLDISSLPTEVQSAIVKYRQEHSDHGYRRIEDYLRDRYFIKVPVKQIRKILKAYGLDKTLDSSFDKETTSTKKGTRRFEASSAKELYQMDISYLYIEKLAVCYLILIIDDHSRFCVGYELTHDQKSLTMINALHHSITDETNKAEAALSSPNIDLSKGYLILKDSYRTLSVTFSEKKMQVFLDGVLLK